MTGSNLQYGYSALRDYLAMSWREACPILRGMREAGIVFPRRIPVRYSNGRVCRHIVSAWYPERVLAYMELWHQAHHEQLEARRKARRAIRDLVGRVGK